MAAALICFYSQASFFSVLSFHLHVYACYVAFAASRTRSAMADLSLARCVL
jgi:hypothetical protein